MQLCNGLCAIARRLNVPFDPSKQRLRYYFNGFLHFRLRNLRSVYRLVDALDFSTAALTRDGQLEVDLIDLCAIDYLRLNLPGVADWIHEQGAEFFSQGGLFGRWRSEEKKPELSSVLPEHLRLHPGAAECYSVLRQLFPSIASSVEVDRVHAGVITNRVCNEKYQLALRDEEHFDAYFVFQPSPRKIPEGVFTKTLSTLKNGDWEKTDFSRWSVNCWLISALNRLEMELPAFTDRQKQDLFIALARDADTYGHHDSLQNLYNELQWASGFMESLLKVLPESERGPLIERLFSSRTSLYARMLFLENMWIRCAPEEWGNREVRSGVPLVSRRRVSELQMALAPDVELAIVRDDYFDHPLRETRLYRWVHSLGVAHTGPTMRRFFASERNDLIWQIMRGVARSISPEYRINFEFGMSYSNSDLVSASGGFFNALLRFVERDFWEAFERLQCSTYPTVQNPDNGDACLIHHVRRALETSASEGEADKS